MTEEDRWHWSAAYLFGDIVAADAYWRRERKPLQLLGGLLQYTGGSSL
jgi:hypothetical protein